jgi:hypothetical protein
MANVGLRCHPGARISPYPTFNFDGRLPSKSTGPRRLGPDIQLFDLPALLRSLLVQVDVQQCADQFDHRSTGIRLGSVVGEGRLPEASLKLARAAVGPLRGRRAQDHRRHPGAAGDREDPCPPGARSAAAAQGSGARGGAALRCLSPSRGRIPIATGCGYPTAGVALRAVSAIHGQHQGQP